MEHTLIVFTKSCYRVLRQIRYDYPVTDISVIKIGNWLRNRNTIEYLGIWESLYNPNFKPLEFEGFKKEAGLNAVFIEQGMPQGERLVQLNRIAIQQMRVLKNDNDRKLLK